MVAPRHPSSTLYVAPYPLPLGACRDHQRYRTFRNPMARAVDSQTQGLVSRETGWPLTANQGRFCPPSGCEPIAGSDSIIPSRGPQHLANSPSMIPNPAPYFAARQDQTNLAAHLWVLTRHGPLAAGRPFHVERTRAAAPRPQKSDTTGRSHAPVLQVHRGRGSPIRCAPPHPLACVRMIRLRRPRDTFRTFAEMVCSITYSCYVCSHLYDPIGLKCAPPSAPGPE